MVLDEKSEKDIVEYLIRAETEHMGLKARKENAKRVVRILYEYKEKIFQSAP